MTRHTTTLMEDGFCLRMGSGPKPGQADVPRQDPKSDQQQHQQHQQHPQPHGDNHKPGGKPTPHGPSK